MHRCRPRPDGFRDDWLIDAGYCLDRYSIEEDGLVIVSRP
jgi:hypothetical protein